MPNVVYDKFNHHALAPTAMCLQLTNQSIHHPAGIAEDIPMKIRNFFVRVDFVILDMGRPLLSMTNAYIDAGVGVIQLNINGQMERFDFRLLLSQYLKCWLMKISLKFWFE